MPVTSIDATGEPAGTSWPQRPVRPRSRRGNYAAGAARRTEIVDAAVEVFSTAGFHKGSLRDVADRVGISQAGVLHHFPSKAHLLEAVLAWRDQQALAVTGTGEDGGLTLLRGLVELVAHNARTRQLVELHTLLGAEGTSADHPSHGYFVERHHRVTAIVTAAFQDLQEKGQLREGMPPSSAARMLLALMDGLQVQWLLDAESIDMHAEIRRFVQAIVTVEL